MTVVGSQGSRVGVADRPVWHGLGVSVVAAELGVQPERGLGAAGAASRLQSYGPNRLAGAKRESGWEAFGRQYRDFIQLILLAAAVVDLVVTRDVVLLEAGNRVPADGRICVAATWRSRRPP